MVLQILPDTGKINLNPDSVRTIFRVTIRVTYDRRDVMSLEDRGVTDTTQFEKSVTALDN
jgi:hypothetical protein